MVRVRFGYGLVWLGLGPVKDRLCSFRICCSSTWRKFLLINCRGGQFAAVSCRVPLK